MDVLTYKVEESDCAACYDGSISAEAYCDDWTSSEESFT